MQVICIREPNTSEGLLIGKPVLGGWAERPLRPTPGARDLGRAGGAIPLGQSKVHRCCNERRGDSRRSGRSDPALTA